VQNHANLKGIKFDFAERINQNATGIKLIEAGSSFSTALPAMLTDNPTNTLPESPD